MINVIKMFKVLLMIVVIITMIYIIGLGYINQHEFVHRQVYSRYGIESYTVINPKFASAVTYVTGNASQCNDTCKLQQGINDSIGYNVAILIFNSWAILITIFIYKGLTGKKPEEINEDKIH